MLHSNSLDSLCIAMQDSLNTMGSSEYGNGNVMNIEFPFTALSAGYSSDTPLVDMTSTLMYTDDTQSETTAKEGIRNLIKEKYENEGLEMPQPVYKEPISPRPQQQSKKEDPETLKKRRERNKIAAMKCRQKRRERISRLQKRVEEWADKNTNLDSEIQQLKIEVEKLRSCFRNHACVQHGHYEQLSMQVQQDQLSTYDLESLQECHNQYQQQLPQVQLPVTCTGIGYSAGTTTNHMC